MTPADAAKLLDLPADATPEQLEARFLELRRKLEDKIAKAPTPGLQAKYRESLAEITAAFEALTLAADSSALPVLKREMGDGRSQMETKPSPVSTSHLPSANSPLPSANSPLPSRTPSRRSGGKEFAIVAVIAFIVLAAGGWWVMQTRAENAEKARIAAEQKAEAERQAQLARDKAEQDKLAREAAAKAEQARIEKLIASLRSRLAELNVGYDAAQRAENAAERELGDLKTQEREAAREEKGGPNHRRLTATLRAQERYAAWLRDTLPTHPARVAKARAEELLSARAADEAARAVEEFAGALDQLNRDLAAARAARAITGQVTLAASHAGVAWSLRDAFGVVHTGTTPATVDDVGAGEIQVEFTFSSFPPVRRTGTLAGAGTLALRADFQPAVLRLRTTPATATLTPQGQVDGEWQVFLLGPGRHRFRAESPGLAPVERIVTVEAGDNRDLTLELSDRLTASLLAEATALLPEAAGRARNFAPVFGHLEYLQVWLGAVVRDGDEEALTNALDLALSTHGNDMRDLISPVLGSADFNQHSTGAGWPILFQPAPAWLKAPLAAIRTTPPNAAQKRPIDHAVDLILAGRDPAESGLRPADLEAERSSIISRLLMAGRGDLAQPLMRNAPPAKDALTGRLRTIDWMAALVAVDRVDAAIELFEKDQALLRAADPTLTYFSASSPATGRFTHLLQIARHRANREGVDKLAALVRRTLRQLPGTVPSFWSPEEPTLWSLRFYDALQIAGLTPEESRMLNQTVAIALSTAGNGRALAPRVPPGADAETVRYARVLTNPYAGGLSYAGNFFRIFAARELVAQGRGQDAVEAASVSDMSRQLLAAIAESCASYALWPAARDALDREFAVATRNADAAAIANYRIHIARKATHLAETYGIAVAERVPEAQAAATLRQVSDPLERFHALCAYVIRWHELQTMTPAQRDYLRSLPPL